MAFVSKNLSAITTVATNDKRQTLWFYDTGDDIATIQAAGYFASAAVNSGVFAEGEARISVGDLVWCNYDAGTTILVITDAAAGTAGEKFVAAA